MLSNIIEKVILCLKKKKKSNINNNNNNNNKETESALQLKEKHTVRRYS